MIRVLLCLLSLGTAAGAASAQPFAVPPRLSLDEALRLAHARNPTLAAARIVVEAAGGDRLDARLRPNPALTVDTENYPLFEPGRPSFLNNQQLTIRLDQEFELAGRRRLRTEVADANVTIAEASAHDQLRRLDLAVRESYLAIVLAEADVEVAQGTLDEIDRVIALNQARHAQGEISGVDVRRVQVERLRFVDDVFNAQLALRNARSSLLALLDAPDLAVEFEVTDSLAGVSAAGAVAPTSAGTALDADALRQQALAARPDLRAARADVQRADTETRLQRALRTPNVTVGGGYQRDFSAHAAVFGVTVPLPFANRNQGGLARAIAERARAEHLATAVEAAVRLDVQQAMNAADVATARVAYIEREYLGPARESRDIVSASYRLGTATLIDFLDAQRAFRDTLRTYNRALYEQRLSLFQLTAATGGAPLAQVTR